MIYCFDIDGTICSDTGGEYASAQPIREVIDAINRLFNSGHRILLYTARGSTTGIDWQDLTRQQLRDWGVNCHEVYFGKPTADIYIDDKAVNIADWLGNPSNEFEGFTHAR